MTLRLRILLFFSIFYSILIGCSPMVTFTQEMRQNYDLSNDEIKKIQFYLSDEIVLQSEHKEMQKNISPTHSLKIVRGKEIEEILFKKKIPGVAVKVLNDSLFISFEKGDHLIFSQINDLDGKYSIEGDEFKIMKTHTTSGYEKLAADEGLSDDSRQISLFHHEAWNGSGYPHGLKGADIPLTSRICKICDVYDALTSKRCYKNEKSPFDSLQLMKTEMKDHLDYDLLMDFINFLGKVFNLR